MFEDFRDNMFQRGDELLFSVTQHLGTDCFTVTVNGDFDPLSTYSSSRLVVDQPELVHAFFSLFTDRTEPILSDRFTDRAPLLWAQSRLNCRLQRYEHQTVWPLFDAKTPLWLKLSMFDKQSSVARLAGMASLSSGRMPWSNTLTEVGFYVDWELYDGWVPDTFENEDIIQYIQSRQDNATLGFGFTIEMDMRSSVLVDKLLSGMDLDLYTREDMELSNIASKIFRNLFPFYVYKGDHLVLIKDAQHRLVMFVNGVPWHLATELSVIVWDAIFGALVTRPSRYSLLGDKRLQLVQNVFRPSDLEAASGDEPWNSYSTL